jgi:hypothetical protein
MIFPEMPLLAHAMLPPHTKLVAMLREPLTRAISGYFQAAAEDGATFEETVRSELDILHECERADMPIEDRYVVFALSLGEGVFEV